MGTHTIKPICRLHLAATMIPHSHVCQFWDGQCWSLANNNWPSHLPSWLPKVHSMVNVLTNMNISMWYKIFNFMPTALCLSTYLYPRHPSLWFFWWSLYLSHMWLFDFRAFNFIIMKWGWPLLAWHQSQKFQRKD